ncbi:MAG TPA: hypothetical protein VKB19_01970 [Pedobacter sp.]|nr:hypothetical protein [Pedobacter sp.]
MKIILQVSLICFGCVYFLFLQSCKKNAVGKDDDLKARFEGKYKIIKAVADRSVDLNLDGSASSNLMSEIPNLEKVYLDLRVNKKTGPSIYSQLWPNQFLSTPDPSGAVYVNFANQATGATFSIDLENMKLNVFRDRPDPSFPLPLSVSILPNNRLKIIMEKNIYTPDGWSKVHVEVEYERFRTEL